MVALMKIVIVGAGEVGYHLADVLSREEHQVSVVDGDPAKSRRIMESLDVQVVLGDGTQAGVLTRAGASKADLVVAVTDSDHVNMLACTLAKHLGAARIILRLKNMQPLTDYHYFYKQTLGFDVVLSTSEMAAEEIISSVREQHALEVETFADGKVQLRRLRLKEECELTSEEIQQLRLPQDVFVVAVARKERFFIPAGEDRLEQGDHVYVAGKAADLDAFERLSGAPSLGKRSVVVMGGGAIGREIARKLAPVPGISLRIIEMDAGRARALAAESGGETMVLEGDATDLQLLMEERIGEADVFVATSDDDECNLIACQLVRNLGVERTVALVNKASYQQIYDMLGIDRGISPRVLCANRILRFVRAGSSAAIAVIGEGRAEVLEMRARFLDGKTERRVRDLGLPRGAVIAALVRGEDVLIPSGSTDILPDDRVLVVTLPEHLETVERLFGAL
jgi:trk system potassium uptake protein TrkA